jgi:2-hydroxychromene-2-carboxylate isomerase
LSYKIDYFFSVMSPWSYFGDARLRTIAAQHGVAVEHKPVDSKVIFSRTGGLALKDRSKERQAYRMRELKRWSARLGININFAPQHYPVSSDDAARVIIAARQMGADVSLLTHALMQAVWVEERNVADHDVLDSVLREQGLAADEMLRSAAGAGVENEYRENTETAIAHGVFGVPAYVFKDDLLWGQDRLEFLGEILQG